MDMSWLQVVVLSVVQGLTEFLPVSSSGHLAIVSQLFFADDAGASFTAVSQLGTELAVLIYFARDIGRILKAWFGGLRDSSRRTPDYWLGWWVIIGTIPIGAAGLIFKHYIRDDVRNLWIIATALVVFSAVIAAAEYFGRQTRPIETVHLEGQHRHRRLAVPRPDPRGVAVGRDDQRGPVHGPGARGRRPVRLPAGHSRGARLGAVLAARRLPSRGRGHERTGPQLLVSASLIAFVVGYAAVAWFLKFLVRHGMYWFVGYRVILGVAAAGPARHRRSGGAVIDPPRADR